MAHEPASGEYEVQARNWQGGIANVARSHVLTPTLELAAQDFKQLEKSSNLQGLALLQGQN